MNASVRLVEREAARSPSSGLSTRYGLSWEVVALTTLIVVGVAIRLHEIGYSFDGDEVFSVRLASSSFSEVISQSLRDRPHPPLHNILLHLWITKAFGASEASVRALSVLFSALLLLVAHGLFRRLMPVWTALGAGGMLTLSPFFVYYGQQARPYALIALLSAANLYAFSRLMDDPRSRSRLAAWSVASALLLYSQYLGIALIACEILYAACFLRLRRGAVLAGGFLACALVLPWQLAAMGAPALAGADPLDGIDWMSAPTARMLVSFYVHVFGSVPGVPGLQPPWLLVVLLTTLGWAYMRRLVLWAHIPREHVFVILIAIGVPLMVWAGSVWGPKPVFASRQLIGSAVAFVTLIGLCLTALPRRAAAVFVLILLFWSAAAVPEAFPYNAKPPWRDMAAAIDARYGPITVAAQDVWVSGPLAHYRTVGAVTLWSDLLDDERRERVLFACRPTLCPDIDGDALRSRRALVETWSWGDLGLQLHLFEIAAEHVAEDARGAAPLDQQQQTPRRSSHVGGARQRFDSHGTPAT